MSGKAQTCRSSLQRVGVSGAALLTAAALAVGMPATASAAPSISPDKAGESRDAIRESADKHGDNHEAKADAFESDGKLLGDPISLLAAADARLAQGEAEQSVEACEAAIETTMVALDMLHFYDAVSTGSASSRWLVIEPGLASGLIGDAEAKIERAEALIEEIENGDPVAEEDTVAAAGKPAKKKREGKPGTGLIVAGSVLAGLGLGGVGVGFAGLGISSSKQKEVEGKSVPAEQADVDKLDEEGRRANLMGVFGLAAGGAVLVGGTALIIVGVIKRKKGAPSAAARLHVSPVLTRHASGVSLTGRF